MLKKGVILTLPIILTILITTVVFSLYAVTPSVPASVSHNQIEGVYCYKVTRADGSVEDLGCVHNIVYNDGLNAIMEDLIDTSANLNFTTIALCNATSNGPCGSPSGDNGQTEGFQDFGSCGLTPQAATGANGHTSTASGSGNRSIAYTFTSTCDGQITNVTKLRDTGGTQRNLSGNSFTTTTLNNNDQLTVNITLFATSG